MKLSETTAVEPDLLYVASDDRLGPRIVEGPPDLVVEVSSPSSRRDDLVRKRDLYERFGVREYWIVDLEADRIEVHTVMADGRFAPPVVAGHGEVARSVALPHLEVEVAAVIAR